jgi:hypothetical protein
VLIFFPNIILVNASSIALACSVHWRLFQLKNFNIFSANLPVEEFCKKKIVLNGSGIGRKLLLGHV